MGKWLWEAGERDRLEEVTNSHTGQSRSEQQLANSCVAFRVGSVLKRHSLSTQDNLKQVIPPTYFN